MIKMKELEKVCMVIIDTINHSEAMYAIQRSLQQIKPAATLFFTDIDIKVPGAEVVKIDKIRSKEEYSMFVLNELFKLVNDHKFNVNTPKISHLLIIQSDGFVLDSNQWDDDFLKYDYIGAPWQYDGRNVGNGGFSLRSINLTKETRAWWLTEYLGPEDEVICRLFRGFLETNCKIKFAPEELASRFSFELIAPSGPTFGFHGYHHKPYVRPVVIKRTGGLGDVVLCEPVLRAFYKMGRKVYLDSPFYDLYAKHFFPVYHIDELIEIDYDYYNLDMAYEVRQPMNYVEAYFEACGLPKESITKPQLKFNSESGRGMFSEPYVVLDLKKRPEAYRNPEFNADIIEYLTCERDQDVKVIILDAPEYLTNVEELGGIVFRPENIQMLMYLLKYAEALIGIDSGPAHVARALETEIKVTFGSVYSKFVHVDFMDSFENTATHNHCSEHCWHIPGGTSGQNCLLSGEDNLKCVKLLK
jgi:ADP-heptose:LPS heptosyltransferase